MLAAEIPSPLKGLLRNFNPILSKPQQDNLTRIITGMLAFEGEKYVNKINDGFIPHKDQSNLNRFITDPKWDYRALNRRRIKLVEEELDLGGSKLCYLILDDTNVERYSGEGVGYHHDSKHGLIKGHNYVTEVCTVNDNDNNDTTYPIDFRLYMPKGSTTTKPFENKIDMACQMVDEFNPPSKHVIVAFDEWYFCGEMVKHVEERGFQWISEAKSNRVVFYEEEERLHVRELLDRSRPFFHDVEVDGELYQCLDTEAFIPKMGGGNTRILFNCKADTKDIHFTCTNILKNEESSSPAAILRHALKRAGIESFHWDLKNVLGFEDYRFRESDAAIIHSHLVLLAYSLLLILKKRMENNNNKRLPNKKNQNHYSMGDACRWVRDRCLVAVCSWFKDRVLEGLDVPKILGLINPRIRIYK